MRLLPGLEEGRAQGGGGRIALALRSVVALLLALLITSCGGGGATVATGAVPPMAPGSLTAELTPNGDALLRWRPPAPGEDRAPVTGYRVYLESTGGQIRRLGDTRSLSYRHRGLQAGERYVYHVRALSAAGQSPPSESVYVDVPHEPVQRPDAPGSLTAEFVPTGEVLLRWTAPPPAPNRASVTGYRVFQELGGGELQTLGETRSLSYRHRGLQAGERYVYHVRALSTAGESPPSESVYVDVPSETALRPDAPGSLTAEFVPTGEVLLRWAAPPPAEDRAPVTGYRVYLESTGGQSEILGESRSLSYRHRGLQAGQRYVYHVRTFSAAGESPPSVSAFVDVPPRLLPPEAPGAFTAELAANGQGSAAAVDGARTSRRPRCGHALRGIPPARGRSVPSTRRYAILVVSRSGSRGGATLRLLRPGGECGGRQVLAVHVSLRRRTPGPAPAGSSGISNCRAHPGE